MKLKILYISLSALLFFAGCKKQADKKQIAQAEDTMPLVSTFDNPSQNASQTPRLFATQDKLYMSWITTKDTMDYLNYAVYEDDMWTASQTLNRGTDWFVNWADFPAIAESDGNILSSYLQKSSDDTYSYDIKLNLKQKILRPSLSDSIHLKKGITLHSDTTKTEHGFVSMIPTQHKNFFITWLDGRNTEVASHNDHHTTTGKMTLRGATINDKGMVINDVELDASVCDCCQTSATNTTNGPAVVYRDRTDAEIRDISIVRFVDNKWTAPAPVFSDNWEIAGCPVNGPAIASNNETVAVAWFTAVNEKPKVQIAFSEDAGATFGIPIRVDSNETLGRIDVAMLNESEVVVVWLEKIEDDTIIQVGKINIEGARGEVITLSKTSGARASGFPQIEIFNNHIVAAFTMLDGDTSHIVTKKLALDKL